MEEITRAGKRTRPSCRGARRAQVKSRPTKELLAGETPQAGQRSRKASEGRFRNKKDEATTLEPKTQNDVTGARQGLGSWFVRLIALPACIARRVADYVSRSGDPHFIGTRNAKIKLGFQVLLG